MNKTGYQQLFFCFVLTFVSPAGDGYFFFVLFFLIQFLGDKKTTTKCRLRVVLNTMQVLKHIAAQAKVQAAHMKLGTKAGRRRSGEACRKVLSDVDDTLTCSGEIRLASEELYFFFRFVSREFFGKRCSDDAVMMYCSDYLMLSRGCFVRIWFRVIIVGRHVWLASSLLRM